MVGTAVTRPSNAAFGGGGGVTQDNAQAQSALNSYRVSAVIDRLYAHVQGIRKCEAVEFLNLCLSLARGIDFAIANNEVPDRSKELPSIIKLVCQNRNDTVLQAAIMVLMISVKSACHRGWFSDKDSEELNNLAKEIASAFGCVPDPITVPGGSHPVISTIFSRFYPKLKMGQVFAFLEVKAGFDAYVIDFQISKKLKHSPGEKIRLFVAQTDNIETSSCLINPANANFLINGRGVDRRTNLSVDTGPQIPTIITQLLKYGSNLLQAVGEFNGNYIVAVAFIRETPDSITRSLKDYEQHATAAVDSDSEITATRISLKCPISRTRIMTPVKGHSCNHFQCFDFDNYVDINSKRPSWRCPSCNQHVCFTEIRIDQMMVKVLKEVGPNVSDIIISSDGSWQAVMESDDATQKPEGNKTLIGEDEPPEPSDILDLTQIDDAMDATDTYGTEDTKNVDLFQLMSQNATINTQVPNGFASGISMPTNVQPNAQVPGLSAPTSVSTDVLNFPTTEVEASDGDLFTILQQTSLLNTLPSQQHQSGNPSRDNESGRFPPIMPSHMAPASNVAHTAPVSTPHPAIRQNCPINFVPNTISAASQASPTAPAVQQSSRNNLNGFNPNSFSASSQPSTAAPGMVTTLRAQSPPSVLKQSSRTNPSTFIRTSFAAPSQASPAAPSMPQAHNASLSQVLHGSLPPLPRQRRSPQNPFPRPQHRQQTAGFQNPNPVQNVHRLSNEHNSSSQQMANLRPPRPMSQQSPGQIQSSVHPARHGGSRSIHETGAPPTSQQAHFVAAFNRSVQTQMTPDVSNVPSSRSDTYDPNDVSWRPTARMRGALTGQAYADALNQFIIQPSQQAQATRPVFNTTSLPTGIPSQVQTYMSAGGAAPSEHPAASPGSGDSYGIP